MKEKIKLFFILIPVVMLSSCMFLTTRVSYRSKLLNDFRDSSVVEFQNKVRLHYDSLSAAEKIKNDALEDEYLLANIKITNDSINEAIFDIINLGEISGRAEEADGGWLYYKIKKKALSEGANTITNLHTTYYDNSGSLWRWIIGANDLESPPIKRMTCTGNVVFIKKKNKSLK